MAAKNKEETLTLDNLESVLSKDNSIKLAGIDIDGMGLPTCIIGLANSYRYPTRQDRVQEEVPLSCQRWLRLL